MNMLLERRWDVTWEWETFGGMYTFVIIICLNLDKHGDLHLTVRASIVFMSYEKRTLAEEHHSLWTYVTTPPLLTFFWIWSIGAKSRKVGDIYKFIVDWVAKPWLLHKDDYCIVVQPTQKETTQVVNFIQQIPGIQWDQWRNGDRHLINVVHKRIYAKDLTPLKKWIMNK